MQRLSGASRPRRFVPRFLIMLLTGVGLFALFATLYVWPELTREPPPGAIADYVQERVRATLRGKVPILALAAVGVTSILTYFGWIPGLGSRKDR